MHYVKHLFGELATKEHPGCARLLRSLAHRALRAVATLLVFGAWLTQQAAIAVTLPSGFQESLFASGLIEPTSLRFAADGRIFVAEKRGVVKVFASLNATTATTLIDLRTNVYNFWDRGLLGLAVHPNFPSTPYLYVLYTYDGDVGSRQCAQVRDAEHRLRPLPDPTGGDRSGLRRQRPLEPLHRPAERQRRADRRAGAGAHSRLVPAVPEPLHR